MKRRRGEKRHPTKITVEQLSTDKLAIRELNKFEILSNAPRVVRGHLRWLKISKITGNRKMGAIRISSTSAAADTRIVDPGSLGRLSPLAALPTLSNPQGNTVPRSLRILLPRLPGQSHVRLPGSEPVVTIGAPRKVPAVGFKRV
jgi:hypothetical protein